MSEWKNDVPSCLKIWIHLKVLKQHNKVFADAGLLKMNQLTFWNQSAGSELIKLSAKTICTQLDNMFRMQDKAVYETGSNTSKAIQEMTAVMSDELKTLADLASAAGANYRFKGEV
jgi:hypothetical protein